MPSPRGRLANVEALRRPEAAHFSPPLTTVHQDFTELGHRIMGTVSSLLDGRDVTDPVKTNPHLVERSSAAQAQRFQEIKNIRRTRGALHMLTPTQNRANSAGRVLGLVATLHQNSECGHYGATWT